jgi:osmotically inducible lipoprotein OsmB
MHSPHQATIEEVIATFFVALCAIFTPAYDCFCAENKVSAYSGCITARQGVLMLNIRHTSHHIAIGLACSVLLLGGCATRSMSKQEIGTAAGAVVGGIVGSSVTGGSTAGTVAGAAGGALVGNQIGKQLDKVK